MYNEYPTKMEANGHIYPINTDYRVALQCIKVYKDNTLSGIEKYFAIEYLLLGENVELEDCEILKDKIDKYLRCGKEGNDSEDTITYDYIQDETLTKTSIRQCYHINLNEMQMHWYEYNELISGLTEEAVINKYREIRGKNPQEIKDEKERAKLIELQNKIAIKDTHIKTEEEKKLDDFWDNITGGS